MKVQPAQLEQVLVSEEDGGVVILSADAGTVAGDLKELDRGLEVRFIKHASHWRIVHVSHPGCPFNEPVGEYGEYLVTTVHAEMSDLGAWRGLDQRIVDRLREIDPRGGYDFAKALEERRREREKHQRDEWHELVGEHAAEAAYSIRRENGERYRGRIFVPR